MSFGNIMAMEWVAHGAVGATKQPPSPFAPQKPAKNNTAMLGMCLAGAVGASILVEPAPAKAVVKASRPVSLSMSASRPQATGVDWAQFFSSLRAV